MAGGRDPAAAVAGVAAQDGRPGGGSPAPRACRARSIGPRCAGPSGASTAPRPGSMRRRGGSGPVRGASAMTRREVVVAAAPTEAAAAASRSRCRAGAGRADVCHGRDRGHGLDGEDEGQGRRQGTTATARDLHAPQDRPASPAARRLGGPGRTGTVFPVPVDLRVVGCGYAQYPRRTLRSSRIVSPRCRPPSRAPLGRPPRSRAPRAPGSRRCTATPRPPRRCPGRSRSSGHTARPRSR